MTEIPFQGALEDYAPPPQGEPIIELSKNAVEFWPCLTPEHHAWLEYYENRMLPFVLALSDIFGVIPIKDLQFQALPNLDKQTSLFLVQTRAGVKEVQGGVELFAVVVVVKYCVVLALKCKIDTRSQQTIPLECVLWNNKERQYTCVTDAKGYIDAPGRLLEVIEKWAVAEKLAAWIPQNGPEPVETISTQKGNHVEEK
jgi:hypothetical protein